MTGPPLRDGAVVVDGGRVCAVGPAAEVLGAIRPSSSDVRDLGPGVLLPGLVNAHGHLELSHLRGRLGRAEGFVAWTEELVAARPVESAVVSAATEAAIREVEETGTVAVGDVSNLLAHLPALAGSSLRAVVFHELIGWDPAAAPRVMEAARARRTEVGGPRPAANVEVRPAAHAPWSVSQALFEALLGEGGPAALHLAESPDETRFFAAGDAGWSGFLARRGQAHVAFRPPGTSPVRYVDGLGVLRPGLVAAHCVQVDDDDLRRLAQRGVWVALCPRSNRNLGVGVPPLVDMRAAGVRFCLGTDSLASVDSLDLMEDVVALHRAFPGVPASALVEAATAGGAEALGLCDLGAIAPGRAAALSFAEGPAQVDDPWAFLVSGEARPRPVRAAEHTLVEGRR